MHHLPPFFAIQVAACNPSVSPVPLGCTDESLTGGSLVHLSEVGAFSCTAISRLLLTMDEFDGGITFDVQVCVAKNCVILTCTRLAIHFTSSKLFVFESLSLAVRSLFDHRCVYQVVKPAQLSIASDVLFVHSPYRHKHSSNNICLCVRWRLPLPPTHTLNLVFWCSHCTLCAVLRGIVRGKLDTVCGFHCRSCPRH